MSTVDAIIISPDTNERSRIKTVARGVSCFKHLSTVSTLTEGLMKLGGDDNCDVLYVSSLFHEETILEFIRSAKQSPRGMDSAYMLMISQGENSGTELASWIVKGSDGFLVEPFSVDDLVNSTTVAMNLKKQRKDTRDIGALGVLLVRAVEDVNSSSIKARVKLPYQSSTKSLTQLNKILSTVSPDVLNVYYENAIERFEAAAPALQPPIDYAGTSKRLQARLIRKKLA